MEDQTPAFVDNVTARRFEYHLGEHFAYAAYRREGKNLYIDYVEAPPELRGSGAAGQLMQHIMQQAATENLDVVPICGYAVSWIRKNVPKP